jgi:hypothetical protein
MKALKQYVPLILLLIIAGFSCKENNSEIDYNPNVKASKDYIYVEDAFFDVINTYFKTINDAAVMGGEPGWIDSAVVNYDVVQNILNFSYGAVNRECHDGKFRRGNIIATFDDTPNVAGTRVFFTFQDHFVDDESLTGEITSEFLEPVQGLKRYGVDIVNGMLTIIDTSRNDTIRLRYGCDFVMTWEEGQETPGQYDDDLLTVTGTSEGISGDDIGFSGEVLAPLNNYIMCNWIQSGIHTLTVPSASVPDGTIDYITEDDCNRQVNFYIENNLFYDYLK